MHSVILLAVAISSRIARELRNRLHYLGFPYKPAASTIESCFATINPSFTVPLLGLSGNISSTSFGARKIRAKLMEQGYTISKRRTLRLIKELDISPCTKHLLPNSADDREYKYYPNKFKRKFITDAPNRTWVSDTTYVRVGSDAYYLCVVIELFLRKVLSYAVSKDNDECLVMQVFTKAFPWEKNRRNWYSTATRDRSIRLLNLENFCNATKLSNPSQF